MIEVLSPNDESREKLPFDASVGVQEVWLVDPTTRTVEMFVPWGGATRPVPSDTGALRSAALGLELRTVAGPRLALRWDGGSAEV